MNDIWKSIAFAVVGLLLGGAPSHFLQLQSKVDRVQVSRQISIEAPLTVALELRGITGVQHEIKVHLAEMSAEMKSLLYEIKRGRRK